MERLTLRWARLAVLAALVTAVGALAPLASAARGGHVFTLTNSPFGNAVVTYDRAADGTLTAVGTTFTGGSGTGAGLGSQGSLVLSGGQLLAVNAGSDSLSLLNAERATPRLRDVEPSGGDRPISVTRHGRLVYVLNAGGTANITGFRVDSGQLVAIPGSTRPLSTAAPDPAQVEFSPDGSTLVVTEKATNMITTYTVGADGVAGPPMPMPSVGMTPFGFAFTSRAQLVVSEAFGGAPDASAASSYALAAGGALSVISPSVPTTETAACWVVITRDDGYAYTTNTGSDSITGYAISRGGALSRLDADGVTAETGSHPIDMALSRGSGYLYALASADGEIDAYSVADDGSLTPVDVVGGLPTSAVGLAAR